MSLFVNEECYLCVSNLGKTAANVAFKELWIDRVSGERVKETNHPVRRYAVLAAAVNRETLKCLKHVFACQEMSKTTAIVQEAIAVVLLLCGCFAVMRLFPSFWRKITGGMPTI